MAEITPGAKGTRFTFALQPPIENFGFEITRYAEGIDDWSHLLGEVYPELFQRHMAETFETEGGATGSRWAPVDPDYARRKQEAGFGTKIGIRTGALLGSMTGGEGYSTTVKGKRSASYGMTEDSQAAPYGSFFADVRPVLRMSQRQLREYLELTQKWVVAEAREAGIGNDSLPESIRLGGGVATHSVLAGAS